jgi:hypothetical protein
LSLASLLNLFISAILSIYFDDGVKVLIRVLLPTLE